MLRRWQKERLDRFFREDVRDLEPIRDLASIQLLAELLPDRIGSPLSLNALREDIEVSHRALTHWMEILERLYHVFRVRPFGGSRVRALKKMPKAYLWDASQVPARAARFENLVGLHLLKLCHYLEDAEGHAVALHYLRDREGREVDFLVTWKGKPWLAVEVKLSETRVNPALAYFRERLKIPFSYQVTLEGARLCRERRPGTAGKQVPCGPDLNAVGYLDAAWLEVAHALEEGLLFLLERRDLAHHFADAHLAPVALRPADDARQRLAAFAHPLELLLRPLVPGEPNVAALHGEGEDRRVERALAQCLHVDDTHDRVPPGSQGLDQLVRDMYVGQ